MTTLAVAAPERAASHRIFASVADIILHRLPSFGNRPAIRYDDGAGYRSVSFSDYLGNVARALQVVGVRTDRQEVVCTFVQNRPEWDMVALATFYSGNVLFPLDTKMHDAEVRHLLLQSPPDVILVSPATRARMKAVLSRLGLSPRILIADLYRVWEDRDAPALRDLDESEQRLSAVPFPTDERFPDPSERLGSDDVVLGHYATSGTVNLPKIVRITHGNIRTQVNEGMDVLNLRPNEDVLNIGPYTHIATLLEFLVTKANGYSVTYFTREADEDGVLEAEIKKLKKSGVRIRALMAVPKFWIFILKEVLEEMRDKPVWGNLYQYFTSIEQHAQLVDIGTMDKAKLTAIRIYLRNKMGGYLSFGITSSTRIDPGVIDIFAKLGVTVIDIYGATEASGIVARNRLNERRRGSCGRLASHLEYHVREPREVPGIDHPVGELLVRGPTISPGYTGQDEIDVDEEGFYHTGDLAWVDEDRWVYLVGREKELIHWDDGTLVDPMHLSNLLVRSIWVKDALVTRLNHDDFLSVFLFPDWPRVEKDAGFKEAVANGVRREEALRVRLLEAVEYAQALSEMTPRLGRERLYLLAHKLERTPTHKIKFLRALETLDLGSYV